MRKMMTKEVTATTAKCGKIEMKEGKPQVTPKEDVIILGNVSLEKAQKAVTKKHGAGVTVFELVADTKVYELPVEEFIKIAKVRTEPVEAEPNQEVLLLPEHTETDPKNDRK